MLCWASRSMMALLGPRTFLDTNTYIDWLNDGLHEELVLGAGPAANAPESLRPRSRPQVSAARV
jgi:hypothetical protein